MIRPGITRAEYERIDAVNWSRAKHALKSAAHFHATAIEDTAAMRLGRCIHLATLQPDLFRAEVVTYDGTRRGREWDAFRAAHQGAEILSPDDYLVCQRIADSVHAMPEAREYLRGDAECGVVGELASVAAKCLVDMASSAGALLDLKSTQDAGPEAFGRQAWTSGYVAQGAWYSDLWHHATGERRPFVLLAVEKEPPFACALYVIDDAELEAGRRQYRRALEVIKRARETNQWPGYQPVSFLKLPRWARDQSGE